MDIQVIATALKSHTNACVSRYKATQKRISESLATANQDLAPTVDRLGRFHSPCDGYEVESCSFAKGQFIPMPELEGDDMFFALPAKAGEFEATVELSGEALKQIKEVDQSDFHGVSISFGKVFTRRGVEHCRAYVKALSMGYLNIIKEQLSAFEESLKAPAKEKGVAPEGKQVIKAVVIGLPIYQSSFGYGQYDFKLMAELDNGATIYGTLPASLSDAVIGDVVQFSANFEHAPDDSTHAFYKRPTKAVIVK